MTSTEKDIHPETIALMSDKEKPVVLSPGWEAYNMPEEQLNFADLSMKDAHLQLNPPTDRLKLIYLILIVHGIGVLMPWNMFINAKDYFMDYKLSKTYTGIDVTYLPKFMFYLQVSAQLPNFIFQWCNVYIRFGGKLSARIVWSIMILLVLFVFTTLMAMIDSSSWPNLFFWMTMITNVAINTASGIYQNTLYGLAAKLPANYAGAIVLGNNISGAFTSIVNILSAGTTSNYRTAAIYYFITAIFVLLICFNTYFGLPLNRFYRYYDQLGESNANSKKSSGAVQSAKQSIPYMRIFKQASPQLFNVFFIFFVTLTLFPDVSSNIKRSQNDFFIGTDLYMNILCFLSFNVCTVIGSYLATVFQWPKPEYLKYVVMLRFIFVPLFLFCNYQPVNVTRTMPVLITSDWAYWLIAIMMATSSGYFSSIAMQSCPGQVAPEHAPIAGMFAGAMLISGIFAGILSSFFWPILVQLF